MRAAVQATPLHVLKIAAGPSGSQKNDSFVLNEERSTFNRTDDREVIVMFQWEGAPGQHRLVAEWRSPDGGATSNSAVNYVAKDRRFGAYWRLTLSPTMQTGTWSIEATVDGQPAGRFSFEVTDTHVAPAAPVKRPLNQAAIYERLSRLFVSIERFSAAGRKLDSCSGILASHGQIYTTVGAIDDVDRLRAVLPDGSARDLQTLIAWARRGDWAVLGGGNTEATADLTLAPPESVNIGDRYFSMEGSATERVLSELNITGQRGRGAGWLATFITGFGTPGAPVVNEYGELVGIVGTALPGATRMGTAMRFLAELKGTPIVPISLFQVRDHAAAKPILEMRQRGDLIPALAREENVLSGGFAREIVRGNTVAPGDQRDEFSAQEKKVVIFVTWSPVDKLKGVTTIRLFDVENRKVAESPPKKVNVGKGGLTLSSWEIPITSLSGMYRADVTLDANPIWRGFVRITP
jgi:hypothetical protein